MTAPSESTPLLAVEGLTAAFPLKTGGTAAAVDGVSFTVARGETFALVGESGSGKTTVSKMIMRALRPDSGRILFDDGSGPRYGSVFDAARTAGADILTLTHNRGKGAALRTGLLAATSPLVGYLDADLSNRLPGTHDFPERQCQWW